MGRKATENTYWQPEKKIPDMDVIGEIDREVRCGRSQKTEGRKARPSGGQPGNQSFMSHIVLVGRLDAHDRSRESAEDRGNTCSGSHQESRLSLAMEKTQRFATVQLALQP